MTDLFKVIEGVLPDGSKLFFVQGCDVTGSFILIIPCEDQKTANRLVDLLTQGTFGIEVLEIMFR